MFKPGDVARLKSGGPVMRVDRARGDKIFVQWMTSGGKAGRGWFSAAALTATGEAGEAKGTSGGVLHHGA
ncbi:DUF2158 domain-containing protein [Siccibacter turicensis]|uniref:DUF2158 domain-containing protein n=1 Tax=Siccibacter turicensis TaxID=357233 RepID=A0A2P8VGV0_9ENTR|nr:hypothetical protein C7G83_14250 [Siccibacter turicensis]